MCFFMQLHSEQIENLFTIFSAIIDWNLKGLIIEHWFLQLRFDIAICFGWNVFYILLNNLQLFEVFQVTTIRIDVLQYINHLFSSGYASCIMFCASCMYDVWCMMHKAYRCMMQEYIHVWCAKSYTHTIYAIKFTVAEMAVRWLRRGKNISTIIIMLMLAYPTYWSGVVLVDYLHAPQIPVYLEVSWRFNWDIQLDRLNSEGRKD